MTVKVIVEVPAATPCTVVVVLGPAVTVATVMSLLVHVPPAVRSVQVILEPAQTVASPVIAAGTGLTVNNAVSMQPLGSM